MSFERPPLKLGPSEKDVDVVVCGTGLTNCILAAALSRAGKRVLHLDANDCFGGSWASFNLKKLKSWAKKPSGAIDSRAEEERQRREEEGDIDTAEQELGNECEENGTSNPNKESKSLEERERILAELWSLWAKEHGVIAKEDSQADEERKNEENNEKGGSEEGSASNNAEAENTAKSEEEQDNENARKEEATAKKNSFCGNVDWRSVHFKNDLFQDVLLEMNPFKHFTREEMEGRHSECPTKSFNTIRPVTTNSLPTSPSNFFGPKRDPSQKNRLFRGRNLALLWNIDLIPRFCFSRSTMVDSFIESSVARYLEFQGLKAPLAIWEPADKLKNANAKNTTKKSSIANSSKTSSNTATSGINSAKGSFLEVPASKSGIFQSKQLSLHEKRALMKFLTSSESWMKEEAGSGATASKKTSNSSTGSAKTPAFESAARMGRDVREWMEHADGKPSDKSANKSSDRDGSVDGSTRVLKEESFATFLQSFKLSERLKDYVESAICMEQRFFDSGESGKGEAARISQNDLHEYVLLEALAENSEHSNAENTPDSNSESLAVSDDVQDDSELKPLAISERLRVLRERLGVLLDGTASSKDVNSNRTTDQAEALRQKITLPRSAGVKKLVRFIRSLAIYGPEVPLLYPKYGICDISQSFIRLASLHGSTPVLTLGIQCILTDQRTNALLGVVATNGDVIKCNQLVAGPEYLNYSTGDSASDSSSLPSLLANPTVAGAPAVNTPTISVLRRTVITTKPLLGTGGFGFCAVAPNEQSKSTIQVLQLDESCGATPPGYYTIHFAQQATEEGGENSGEEAIWAPLDSVVEAMLQISAEDARSGDEEGGSRQATGDSEQKQPAGKDEGSTAETANSESSGENRNTSSNDNGKTAVTTGTANAANVEPCPTAPIPVCLSLKYRQQLRVFKPVGLQAELLQQKQNAAASDDDNSSPILRTKCPLLVSQEPCASDLYLLEHELEEARRLFMLSQRSEIEIPKKQSSEDQQIKNPLSSDASASSAVTEENSGNQTEAPEKLGTPSQKTEFDSAGKERGEKEEKHHTLLAGSPPSAVGAGGNAVDGEFQSANSNGASKGFLAKPHYVVQEEKEKQDASARAQAIESLNQDMETLLQ